MGRRDRSMLLPDLEISPARGGGHTYLLDSIAAVAPLRSWNGPHFGRRLRRNRNTENRMRVPSIDYAYDIPSSSSYSENPNLEDSLRRLSFTHDDLQQVMDDPEQFRSLQSQLRQRGAITNSMIKEGIHLYVQECLELNRRQHQGESSENCSPRKIMITPTNASIGGSSNSSRSARQTPSFNTPQSC